ncbi:hypothetical protein [Streptomyces sp. WAC08241]|uniref:hypothetical protein n=1 Tax=Streptomyces sp. WAC08241 TaxID=2487421 RepID=UPI000F78F17C|nr:hypothetical protein [Streptomyces sp. WAC08241]RSS45923.1 hypothetical protein EF906_03240 [Streptomyces sp. WAC08241]
MCHPAWARARTEARRPKDLTEEEGDATTAGAAEAAGIVEPAGTAGQKAGHTAGRTGRPVPVV